MENIFQDAIYPIVCVEFESLSGEEKIGLINYYHQCYFDTDQEVEVFAVEFQRVVAHILSDCIPISLSYLEDFVTDELIETLSDEHQVLFKSIFNKSIKKEFKICNI